jgi:metal-dependent amidase/aminoacylase/carboxypeptidase family protein
MDLNVLIQSFVLMEAGKVFYREGFVQTGRAYFKLKVQGSGGHGSSPHMLLHHLQVLPHL